MLQVKRVVIGENLLNNSRSTLTFECIAHKGFESLTKNISGRNLLTGKVDCEKLEVRICLYCLGEGVVQLQDEEGLIPLAGSLWIAKDGRGSYINLSTNISYNNWIKLKSDVLLVSPRQISLDVSSLFFEKIAEDEDCYESDIKLSLHKYCIDQS